MGGEDELGCSGGFQYVSRKGKPRRNRRRRGLQEDGGQEGAGKEEERDERLAKRCEIIAAKKAFLSTGDAGRQMDMLLSAVDARQKGGDSRLPSSILALGLGSVKESRPAQLQLAFMLLVRDWLSKKGSRIVDVAAYDPVFDDEDRDLLAELAIRALDENVQGHYPLQHTSFVYMPHCTKTLYENILRANWSPEGLDRLWLCCNELDRYVGKSSSVKETAPCITRIATRLTVDPLPVLAAPHNNAFNDLAIQRFKPPDIVDELAASLHDATLHSHGHTDPFWTLPSPVDQPNDPELI